jgi:hypothetical protein
MNNFGIVNPSEWVGMTLENAKNKAEHQGYTVRVTEINGNPLMVTHDLKSNRINFRISNNLITDAYTG